MFPCDHMNMSRRPGLAYQYAFDWLAGQLQTVGGSSACLVPSLFQGVELLRRLPKITFLDPILTEIDLARTELGFSQNEQETIDGSFAAIAWAEPRRGDEEHLAMLVERLAFQGRLYIVAGGPLARFLAEQRSNNEDLLPASHIRKRLKKFDLRLVHAFGLYGFGSISWHYAGQALGGLGRQNWQDRCHYGMRRAYVVHGRGHSNTALVCLTVEHSA